MGLETKTIKLNIVIRKNIEIDKSKIKAFCEERYNYYAFIEHKGDISKIDGVVEGVHYHIVARAKQKQRIATILNDIVRYFGFDNPFGVQIEPYRSLEGSLQYLIHKNDKDKTQHDISEIIHNFDKEEFDTLMTSENDTLTIDRLIVLINQSDTFTQLFRAIGLGYAKMYLNVIKEIWKDLKG